MFFFLSFCLISLSASETCRIFCEDSTIEAISGRNRGTEYYAVAERTRIGLGDGPTAYGTGRIISGNTNSAWGNPYRGVGAGINLLLKLSNFVLPIAAVSVSNKTSCQPQQGSMCSSQSSDIAIGGSITSVLDLALTVSGCVCCCCCSQDIRDEDQRSCVISLLLSIALNTISSTCIIIAVSLCSDYVLSSTECDSGCTPVWGGYIASINPSVFSACQGLLVTSGILNLLILSRGLYSCFRKGE